MTFTDKGIESIYSPATWLQLSVVVSLAGQKTHCITFQCPKAHKEGNSIRNVLINPAKGACSFHNASTYPSITNHSTPNRDPPPHMQLICS